MQYVQTQTAYYFPKTYSFFYPLKQSTMKVKYHPGKLLCYYSGKWRLSDIRLIF